MNRFPVIFMFTGLGSQYYQMARQLFFHDHEFAAQMRDMDAVMSGLTGKSVLEALYETSRKKSDPFDGLELSGSALFMIQHALATTLTNAGIVPDYVLGASLGTFAAAVQSGMISRDEALGAIVAQAEVVRRHCRRGGMVAVLADPATLQLRQANISCEVAGINMASHCTLAMPEEDISVLERYLRARGIAYQRLPITYAFHSRWIAEAEEGMSRLFDSLPSKPGRIPLLCCATARMHLDLPGRHFWKIAREPILLRDSIMLMERYRPGLYIDVGPNGSLAGLIKYLKLPGSRSEARMVLNPFNDERRSLEALLNELGVVVEANGAKERRASR